jgi:peptide/nickel transport system permease protein
MQRTSSIKETIELEAIPPVYIRIARAVRKFATRKPLGAIGFALLMMMIMSALFAPVVATHDPNEQSIKNRLESSSAEHWFGTDQFGRDLFSRVVYGGRVSLRVAFQAVIVAKVFGLTLGLVSGYFGGRTDLIIQRLVDIQMAFPRLILTLAIVAMFSPSLNNVAWAIAIGTIPSTVRVVRAQALSVKEMDYVEAARALGASPIRIMTFHILPQIWAPLIIIASASLGAAILTETSLSFLGLGVPPPAATWGGMLSGASQQYMERAPWLVVWPGVAISCIVFGFNLFGDALRDVLDPRLRGSQG